MLTKLTEHQCIEWANWHEQNAYKATSAMVVNFHTDNAIRWYHRANRAKRNPSGKTLVVLRSVS